MTQEDYRHPIAPPPELVQHLCDKAILHAADGAKRGEIEVWLIQEAFRAGADQELEACIAWFDTYIPGYELVADRLRAARRPKPPSLKEQALEMLENTWKGGHISNNAAQTIRRALEQLPDNE
jgi:hypothetical protein